MRIRIRGTIVFVMHRLFSDVNFATQDRFEVFGTTAFIEFHGTIKITVVCNRDRVVAIFNGGICQVFNLVCPV